MFYIKLYFEDLIKMFLSLMTDIESKPQFGDIGVINPNLYYKQTQLYVSKKQSNRVLDF